MNEVRTRRFRCNVCKGIYECKHDTPDGEGTINVRCLIDPEELRKKGGRCGLRNDNYERL